MRQFPAIQAAFIQLSRFRFKTRVSLGLEFFKKAVLAECRTNSRAMVIFTNIPSPTQHFFAGYFQRSVWFFRLNGAQPDAIRILTTFISPLFENGPQISRYLICAFKAAAVYSLTVIFIHLIRFKHDSLLRIIIRQKVICSGAETVPQFFPDLF